MKISMTARGDSEQIVGLTADVVAQAIKPMSRDVYKDMDYFFESKKARRLRQAAYAMAQVTAEIEWRPPFDENNLDARYMKATLLPKSAAQSRLSDIHRYVADIARGDVFPLPILFKQGELLIQVDGARRIVSQMLAGRNRIEVIVVIERTQIHTILDKTFIDEVQEIQSSEKWFGDYQDIIELGIKGRRRASARFPDVIDLSCCRDRTVVDFGCNVGHALFEAYFNGAKRCVGFEYTQSNVDLINKIAARLKIPVEAYCIDFNAEDYQKNILSIIPAWDHSLFLSVYRTRELKDRNGLLKFIWNHTGTSMFFEGHSERIDTNEFYAEVFRQLAGATVTLLGVVGDLGSYRRLNYNLRKLPGTVNTLGAASPVELVRPEERFWRRQAGLWQGRDMRRKPTWPGFEKLKGLRRKADRWLRRPG